MTELVPWATYAGTPDPDINDLKRALDHEDTSQLAHRKIEAIRLKYQSMTTPATAIEKTMTPSQLFAIGHPLWARTHTIVELCDYVRYKKYIKTYEDFQTFLPFQFDFTCMYPKSMTDLDELRDETAPTI